MREIAGWGVALNRSMQIFDQDDNVEVYGSSFWIDLVDPLIVVKNTLRSKAEYDDDENPPLLVLRILRQIRDACPGHMYLALSEQSITAIRRLKTYKGLLWGNPVLRSLERREFEADAGKNLSRLGAVAMLDDFDFCEPESALFNWGTSCYILSSLPLEPMAEKVRQWLQINQKRMLGFDYSRIARDLPACDGTAVLRYFPVYNRHPESFALLSTRETFEGIRHQWLRIFQPRPTSVT